MRVAIAQGRQLIEVDRHRRPRRHSGLLQARVASRAAAPFPWTIADSRARRFCPARVAGAAVLLARAMRLAARAAMPEDDERLALAALLGTAAAIKWPRRPCCRGADWKAEPRPCDQPLEGTSGGHVHPPRAIRPFAIPASFSTSPAMGCIGSSVTPESPPLARRLPSMSSQSFSRTSGTRPLRNGSWTSLIADVMDEAIAICPFNPLEVPTLKHEQPRRPMVT
jgi:hypothetical protein